MGAEPRAEAVDGVDWRARLSRRAVQVLAAASVIGVTLIHFTKPSAHLLTATHWYFLPVAVLLCAATFIRKGGWRWQARIAIGGVLALGCAGAATVGLLGGPAVVLCVALLLSALLLGRKATWATLTLMVLGVALIAFAMVTGRIAAPTPTDVSFVRVQPWLRSGAMALMMLAVIAMTVAVVIENLEAALARAQSEITARERAELERAQALRIALEAQKLETVGRLAASVAHDFNNALCVIDMCNQQLARPSAGSDQPALREMIGQAVTQASSLARQLLLLARKHVPAPSRVALRAFVEELGGTLPRILPVDVQVQIEAGDDALVFVDRVQLQHALLNLAMNARDAMPHGGRLVLRARTVHLPRPLEAISGTLLPGSWAVFEVEDTGTGMDELTRAHAFEPLFTTKPVGHGTGLGLSSVLTAMELSAGYVTLWTERGVGTRVTLWLPVVGAGPVDASPVVDAAPIDLRGRTVLVVEDTASVLQLVREVLVGAGCTVLTASDGSEALRRLEEHHGPIDVLCTDVVMPGAPVRQVLARFRQLHPAAPILIVSGYVADELALRGIAEGRYRQLPKPFTVSELLHTVGELTRPKAARSDHS